MKTRSFTDQEIAGSYALAQEIMKERAVSFYQAFSPLPGGRFPGICALYAFCRAADDMVDLGSASPAEKNQALDTLERQLLSLYGGQPPEEPLPPWWPAFADTVRRFGLPKDSFLRQIEGQRRDASFAGIKTVDELISYSRLVAGSVGTMLLPLLAAPGQDLTDPAFQRACENLGVAMQITNILRDVGEDLRLRGRLYLPEDLLNAYGVSRESLQDLSDPKKYTVPLPSGFILLWEHLADLADVFYKDCERCLDSFHPACRASLLSAAFIYRAIADAVRQNGYDCFTRRCYTDEARRNQLMQQALERSLAVLQE